MSWRHARTIDKCVETGVVVTLEGFPYMVRNKLKYGGSSIMSLNHISTGSSL